MFGKAPEPTPPQTEYRPAVIHAVKTMPRWKWRLLAVALVIGCIGVAGQAALMFNKTPAPAAPVSHSVSTPQGGGGLPTGSSGFVGGQPTAASPDSSTTPTPAAGTGTWITQMMTPLMTHVGFSIFVGVIVGLIFRAFIKIALTITALIAAAAAALSYYHVINIDMSSVDEQARHASSWVAYQGNLLKEMLFKALPSSTAAGVGFVFGFKKR